MIRMTVRNNQFPPDHFLFTSLDDEEHNILSFLTSPNVSIVTPDTPSQHIMTAVGIRTSNEVQEHNRSLRWSRPPGEVLHRSEGEGEVRNSLEVSGQTP